MHDAKSILSITTLRNIGIQAIHQGHWSFHLYLSQCNILHNLHPLQKVIHWQNREMTRWKILRAPSWHRERWQKGLYTCRETLPSHSNQHMEVWGLSLHQWSMESCKTLEQKLIFSNYHSYSSQNQQTLFIELFILLFFLLPCNNQECNSIFLYINHTQPTITWFTLTKGKCSKCLACESLYIINPVDKTKLSCNTQHWCSTTVPLETYSPFQTRLFCIDIWHFLFFFIFSLKHIPHCLPQKHLGLSRGLTIIH